MAGEDLYGALAGLNYDPAETGYGTSSQVLASSLPNLMNPYQGAGTNIGIALGGALISGLLGYQARQSAAEQSLEANKLGLQLLEAQSPQARLGIIESTPDTVMQGKLLGVNTRLAAQQAAQQQMIGQEIAKQKALAEFELGPLGTQLFERGITKEAQRQAALTGGFTERQQLEDRLIRERALQRKQLGLEDVNVPPPIFNKAIERNASSDLALDVATTIDTYKSIPEFAAAKNISAFGDEQLKSRLRNLATIVLQSRSGLAATDRERVNLDKILTGDFTAVEPETVSGILRRFARDEKTIAADIVAAGTQRPEAFVSELRQALQEGRPTQFGARTPGYAEPAITTPTTSQQPNAMKAGQDFMTNLKSKYGIDWKSKITDNEKTTLTALVNAAKGQ